MLNFHVTTLFFKRKRKDYFLQWNFLELPYVNMPHHLNIPTQYIMGISHFLTNVKKYINTLLPIELKHHMKKGNKAFRLFAYV